MEASAFRGGETEWEGPPVSVVIEQMKAILALQKASLEQLHKFQDDNHKRLKALEACPCRVHHDPGQECPLTTMSKRVAWIMGIGVGASFILNVGVQFLVAYLRG